MHQLTVYLPAIYVHKIDVSAKIANLNAELNSLEFF